MLRSAARFRYRVRALAAASALRELAGRGGVRRLLDLGCAEGKTLLELRRLLRPEEIVGVEASEELIAMAPPLPLGVRIESGDVTRLPKGVGPEPFDAVTALAVLEHLPEPVAAVREARRVLRPGGLFVATCPEPRWDVVATRLGLLEGAQHEVHLGRRRLERIVGEGGFELVSYRRFMFAPVGALPYLRIPVSPAGSWAVDRAVAALRVLDWSFVNQRIVARRPVPREL